MTSFQTIEVMLVTTDPSTLSSVSEALTAHPREHVVLESGFAYVPADASPLDDATLSAEDEDKLDSLCKRLLEDSDVDSIWTLRGQYVI